MRSSTLLFCSLSLSSAFAQEPQSIAIGPAKSRLWSIGASFSPEAAYRTLFVRDQNETTSFIVDSRDKRETARFGYTTAVNIGFRIGTHWGIQSGIAYSLKGYRDKKLELNELTFGDFIEPRRGYTYQAGELNGLKSFWTHSGFQYLAVPLQLNYTAGQGKWKSITTIGASMDLLIKATQTSVVAFDDGHKDRDRFDVTDSYNTFCITPTFSTGVVRAIGARLQVRVEPVLRYGAMRIIETSVSARLWNAGVNCGFFYSL